MKPVIEDLKKDISSQLAVNAYSGISFTPEKRGSSIRDCYAQTLAQDYDDLAKYAETEDEKNLLIEEFARYREGYAAKYRAWLSAKSRCLSWAITGPANFPTRRNEKRNATEDRRFTELVEFRKRALAAITKKLRPELRPIMAGDSDAVEALQVKIQKAEEVQAKMKKTNDTIRKFKKDGEAPQVAALIEFTGFSEKMARELLKPDCCGRIGFAGFELTNNNANLRRMKERLEKLQQDKAATPSEVLGPTIRLEDDPAANRIRIFFPGKPSEEIRAGMRSAAFRWTPSLGCWQAYRNYRTLELANAILRRDREEETLARQAAGEMVQGAA